MASMEGALRSPLLDYFRRGEAQLDIRILAARGVLAPRAPGYVATLTQAADCAWEDAGAALRVGSRLLPGELRLRLRNTRSAEYTLLLPVPARAQRVILADIRRWILHRVEQHQATMINWLLSADHSPLETTIAYEQVAIEVTAAVAQAEPDPYQAQIYRFGLLEDFDHLYRYSGAAGSAGRQGRQ